ncbi:MAG: hypothetical protein N2039_16490 [Gemmataceae bacterium]|nr:hypothetical protein [Gemmataceae bacterium]
MFRLSLRLSSAVRVMVPCAIALSWELWVFPAPTKASDPLPGTGRLTSTDDLAAKMVEGIDRYLTRLNEQARGAGSELWRCDHSSVEAYRRSIEPNRDRLRRILGIVDPRVSPVVMEYVGRNGPASVVGTAERFVVHRVRWRVLDGVDGEGLLLEPTGPVKAQVVAIPDADQSPEQIVGLSPGVPAESQFAKRLADSGCRVLVPVLINRRPTEPPSPLVPRQTNIPHREFVWRMAYEMGRHIIGLEVQKVLAAIDWFTMPERPGPIGVFGYGEGGVLALYAGAVDPRIHSTVVSGVPFDSRHRMWEEPIDRSIWAALPEFRDDHLIQMFGDGRTLIFEHSHPPQFELANPPGYRQQAAPGRLFLTDEASRQIARATELRSVVTQQREVAHGHLLILATPEGKFGHAETVKKFATSLNLGELPSAGPDCERKAPLDDDTERHRRQFRQLVDYIQRLWRRSDATRRQFFAQADFSSPEAWQKSAAYYRDYFWREVIGKLSEPTLPMNPRSRRLYDEPKWTGYEVVLDVYDDVFAFGHFLLPKDIRSGERRPVVVCQHGLEGRPDDLTDPRRKNVYHQLGARLADMGYIVFAPQNPYIGWEKFRILRRKSDPLQLSLFSFIVRQHERILNWLSGLPQVDPQRIGFYGLSYGGKTAMRVPAILERYALSICSADFNEWIGKNVTIDLPLSYMYTIEYDMYEFNLGNTFNYAEMAYLIAPRPFMVERGHDDGVGIDEMVAAEYAKVRYLYANRLRIPERTAIEFFPGGHEIRLEGTAEFLRRHLNWPK